MSRPSAEGSARGKRKVKKQRFVPATPDDIALVVNTIRTQLGIKQFKMEPQFELMVSNIVQNQEVQLEGCVILSLLSLVEDWDGKTTTPDLVAKWMDDPGKRHVVLAPGNRGWIAVSGDKLVMMVMTLFH